MPLSLPRFTFLNGPKGSGKTTLCNLLVSDPQVCVVAFAAPIRQACTATFFPDSQFDLDFDLRSQEKKNEYLPNSTVSIREWMVGFGHWMRLLMGTTVFSEIALRTCMENDFHYSRFVLDGTRTDDDLYAFMRANAKDCVLIQIKRRDASWDGDLGGYLCPFGLPVYTITNNGEPRDMLRQLAQWFPEADDLSQL